jgi:hypothetical protein
MTNNLELFSIVIGVILGITGSVFVYEFYELIYHKTTMFDRVLVLITGVISVVPAIIAVFYPSYALLIVGSLLGICGSLFSTSFIMCMKSNVPAEYETETKVCIGAFLFLIVILLLLIESNDLINFLLQMFL